MTKRMELMSDLVIALWGVLDYGKSDSVAGVCLKHLPELKMVVVGLVWSDDTVTVWHFDSRRFIKDFKSIADVMEKEILSAVDHRAKS